MALIINNGLGFGYYEWLDFQFPSKRSFYVYMHFISTRAQTTISFFLLFRFHFSKAIFGFSHKSHVASESKMGIQQMGYVRGHHHTHSIQFLENRKQMCSHTHYACWPQFKRHKQYDQQTHGNITILVYLFTYCMELRLFYSQIRIPLF